MLQLDQANKLQFPGRVGEPGHRDRVPENVAIPTYVGGRRDDEQRIDQPQVVAIARTKHQPVAAEHHRVSHSDR